MNRYFRAPFTYQEWLKLKLSNFVQMELDYMMSSRDVFGLA